MPVLAAGIQDEGQSALIPGAVRLGDILLQRGLITPDQLRIALHEQRNHGGLLGDVLIRLGFLEAQSLAQILAAASGCPAVDIAAVIIDGDVLRQLPRDIATHYRALPFAEGNGGLHIAVADPYDVAALDALRPYFSQTALVPFIAPESDILAAIDRHYGYTLSVDGIVGEIEDAAGHGFAEAAQDPVHPVIRLADGLIQEAIRRNASDIHFEPESKFIRLRYRIDGVLHQAQALHRDHWPALSHRIKIMAGLNIADQRSVQDGRFSVSAHGTEIDCRVSVLPTVWGENIVVRLLDHRASQKPLDALGFSDHCLGLVHKMTRRPQGMILVTGPTGSGKTTTLYSMLRRLSTPGINIMTLEEPVEYQIGMLRQTQVREQQGLGFAEGVRAILRQDPDVIFIGEVRDQQTAQMAMRAAMTGHRVFSTLHTNDALGAVPRLIDLGLHPRVLSGNVSGVIAQRLVRTLCPGCKAAHIATTGECRLLGLDDSTNLRPLLHHAQGCESCYGTGYQGRTVVAETLRLGADMEDLYAAQAPRRDIRAQACRDGYIPMIEDGVTKVLKGEISLESLAESVDLTDRM